MSDREMLGVRVPDDLKALVDADDRTNQEIVEAALWREYGGERQSALERRIEEKKRRISMIESERNERNRELNEMQDELEALESKLDATESVEERTISEAVETFTREEIVRMEPDHAPAQHWADKADVDPAVFVDRLKTAVEGDDDA